jgi:hypothetical protein
MELYLMCDRFEVKELGDYCPRHRGPGLNVTEEEGGLGGHRLAIHCAKGCKAVYIQQAMGVRDGSHTSDDKILFISLTGRDSLADLQRYVARRKAEANGQAESNGQQQTKKELPYQLEALTRLNKMGYNLIPLKDKFPPCVKWKQYQTEPITLTELVEWQRKFSGDPAYTLNWGLLTGSTPYSNAQPFVVVDADDGEAEELVRARCPVTPVMQRTSRGLHRVYRRPAEVDVPYIASVRNITIEGKKYKLDIRGEGGYICAPGSIHCTGAIYTEVTPWTAELIATAPIYDPAWLPYERSEKDKKERQTSDKTYDFELDDEDFVAEHFQHIKWPLEDRRRQADRYLYSVPGAVQGEGADNQCCSLTMRLLYGFALPAKIVFELLHEWGQKDDNVNKEGGYYPWSEEEIRRKIEWAMNETYRGDKVGDKLTTWESYKTLEALYGEEYFSGDRPSVDEPTAAAPLGKKTKTGYSFSPISSAQFAQQKYELAWLIKHMLVMGQPCVVGGPKKALKTSLLVDLCLSLGSGTRFLNNFYVPKPVRTILISGESGAATGSPIRSWFLPGRSL